MAMFKKKEKIMEEDVVMEAPQENQLTVQVKDIKQYLVDEYIRVGQLRDTLAQKDDYIEDLKETELKYKASLVTLEEFDRRLRNKDDEIEEIQDKLELKKKELGELNEKYNTTQILMNRLKDENRTITKKANASADEIGTQAVSMFSKDLVIRISQLKGQLSKAIIIELIDSFTKGVKNGQE